MARNVERMPKMTDSSLELATWLSVELMIRYVGGVPAVLLAI